MKKITEFKTLSMDELMQKERDLRKELFNLRFRHKMGELENPMKIREVRKDIARVKTIMSELGKRG
ncbi:MAG: 50S ribosomal protein L29 [Nitrospirae bacterium]|nr:50S ribosomal protein L29 [Nitrospirota bacterium]